MITFIVTRDFEKPDSAGAAELFQLISVTDEDDNDLSDKIDAGRMFSNEENLKKYLRKAFKMMENDEINIEYDDIVE